MNQLQYSGPNPGGAWNDNKSSVAPVAAKTKKKYREYGLRPSRALQRFCREIGGTNPFGGPMYRLSWAPSQLTWMGGKWRINDEHGNFKFWHIDSGWAPKYPQLGERFILETWKPAEVYGSPLEWESMNREFEEDGQMLGKLGPYPNRGGYEVVFHFQDTDGGFVCPTQTIIERRIQEHLRIARKQALLRAMAKETRDYEEWVKKRGQSDIIGEGFAGFLGAPYVSLSGLDVPSAALAAISTTTQEVS